VDSARFSVEFAEMAQQDGEIVVDSLGAAGRFIAIGTWQGKPPLIAPTDTGNARLPGGWLIRI
jgi:hypothetical protein